MTESQIEELLETLNRIATGLEQLTMTSREVMDESKPGVLGKVDLPVVVRWFATELNVIGR